MAGQRVVQASGVGVMLLRSALLTRKQPELNYRGTGVIAFFLCLSSNIFTILLFFRFVASQDEEGGDKILRGDFASCKQLHTSPALLFT